MNEQREMTPPRTALFASTTFVVLRSCQCSASGCIDCFACWSCTTKTPVLILLLARDSPCQSCTTKLPVLSFQLHRFAPPTKVVEVASSHHPAPQTPRVLKLHYKFASFHHPSPQTIRIVKLHYKVTSSARPAQMILCFQLHRLLRVLQLYYKQSRQFFSSSLPDNPRTRVVLQCRACSQLPAVQIAPRHVGVCSAPVLSAQDPSGVLCLVAQDRSRSILPVPKFFYKVATSQLPACHTLRVLKLHYKEASSQPQAPQTLCLPRNLHMEVHKVLCLRRNPHMEMHKVLFLPRSAAHATNDICTWSFTKSLHLRRRLHMEVHKECCTCHEICTWRFTKCCTCHDICTKRFTKCCTCNDICAWRFTKHCTCHEICT